MRGGRGSPLLPPEPVEPKGGRPRVSDRAALTGILLVLKMGIPWEHLPAEMGCESGMTCWRGPIASPGTGPRGTPPRCRSPEGKQRARTQRIAANRARRAGFVVDAHGIRLAVLVSAANVHGSTTILATVDAIEPIRPKTRGRPLPACPRLVTSRGSGRPGPPRASPAILGP